MAFCLSTKARNPRNTVAATNLVFEILPSSTVEETCTVNLNKDDKNMEYTETHGKYNNFYFDKIMGNVFRQT